MLKIISLLRNVKKCFPQCGQYFVLQQFMFSAWSTDSGFSFFRAPFSPLALAPVAVLLALPLFWPLFVVDDEKSFCLAGRQAAEVLATLTANVGHVLCIFL